MQKKILIRFYKEFVDDVCTYRAAGLTLSTLFSLVPLVVISFSILSFFSPFQIVRQKVEHFILTNLVSTSGEAVQQYIESFAHQASNLSVISFIFLFITLIQTMFSIEQSLNAIFRVTKHRHFFKAFFLYIMMIIVTPILLGLSFLITLHLESLPFISDTFQLLKLTQLSHFILPFALSTLALTFLYSILPHRKMKLGYCFIGASITSLLLEALKKAFALYITYFPTYHILYGALSAIPIFLLWIYLCWVIVLLGAIIIREFQGEEK